MCIELLHLRKDLTSDITLPENCFYIGGGVLNLAKSLFYRDLSCNDYKQWLWNEIKAKATVYQELSKIKSSIIIGNNIILACSCSNPKACNGQIIKKAISYLLQEEQLSGNNLEPSTLQEYLNMFPISEDKLHEFCYWLTANNYPEDKVNYYLIWIKFILQRQIA